MTASFFVVPQWQGSASSRAMRLADGALAISGDLPSSATTLIEVPAEAGDEQGTGVHRLTSLVSVRDRLLESLASASGTPITIGGDCGVEAGAVGHALSRRDGVAVVWFDAHPDLNTPTSSPSHAFCGMVLRTLLGDGPDALAPAQALGTERLVLAGSRELDAAESDFVGGAGIRMLDAASVSAESLVEAVAATGATAVYIHVDLDVLDPAELSGVGAPVPFGVSASTLAESIRALVARFELAGAGVMGFSPQSPEQAIDDMPTILRVIGALTSGR